MVSKLKLFRPFYGSSQPYEIAKILRIKKVKVVA
jgi:hypothetical protein